MTPRFVGQFGGGGGASSLIDWTQVTAVDQGSGVPVDTLGIGDTGTVFSAGVFRHVWASHTSSSNADGYNEGVLWWSMDLLSLYPTFDPEVHTLDLVADFSQFGVGVNDGAGAFVGIADAALGSANASVSGIHRAGVGNMQMRKLNTTSATSGGDTPGDSDQVYLTAGWFDAGGTAWRPSATMANRTAGAIDQSTVNPEFETLGTTLSSWRLVTGAYHVSAPDPAGLDVRWTLYHRLVSRASGPLA